MGAWHGIETFLWEGYEWIRRPFWGTNHPDVSFTYYDEGQTKIDGDGNVSLDFAYIPKPLPMADGGIVVKPYAQSLCRTTSDFRYGDFEWEMRMPCGRYLWPALWLASDYSWPPEIDCMEGWSGKNPNYVKRLFFKNIHPTMHWTEDGEHKSRDKKNIWRFWFNGSGRFDRYTIEWRPEHVIIRYNGHLVSKFSDRAMLDEMNNPDVRFHAIMSFGPYSGFTREDYEKYERSGQSMTVRSFSYKPL